MKTYLMTILLTMFCSSAIAGEADVVKVLVKKSSKNTYNFGVSLFHSDTGWDHYADKWDIIDSDGIVIGTRILHHPHVNEQPFSRSLTGVVIPEHIKEVTLRAHDSVHKYGGKTITVKLPK